MSQALRQNVELRDQFVARACHGEPDLMAEVNSLLSSLERGKTFLEKPIVGADRPAPSWQLQNGQRVSHYLIIEPIASGGMGEVYLARDLKLVRNVALKLLAPELCGDRARMQRFRREAEMISSLNHPNILTLYEFDTVDGMNLLATEFVEGETLRQRMKRGRLTVEKALEIGSQIASALKAAHEAGIVHRDIKPENVMIREDGYIKVLDFGSAKPSGESRVRRSSESGKMLSLPGMILGTVRYMSPEQARGNEIDSRSDIFSFGVVMYEMLAGKPPFDGETMTDILAVLLQAEPEPLGRMNAAVPQAVTALVNRCIRKEPAERYGSAAEIVDDISRARHFTGHV